MRGRDSRARRDLLSGCGRTSRGKIRKEGRKEGLPQTSRRAVGVWRGTCAGCVQVVAGSNHEWMDGRWMGGQGRAPYGVRVFFADSLASWGGSGARRGGRGRPCRSLYALRSERVWGNGSRSRFRPSPPSRPRSKRRVPCCRSCSSTIWNSLRVRGSRCDVLPTLRIAVARSAPSRLLDSNT